MRIAGFALLFVVFLDVMNQGLVIPILNTIIVDPTYDFMPKGTASSIRELDFGLVMGVFFLCWFLGAAYISKVSDFIGRRAGVLICLSGNLLGYVLTIVALDLNSFAILLVARAISGFTAGNQPIAQAALVDVSTSEEQKARYMGLVLLAVSLGLMAGPLIGGVLSDTSLLGGYASLELPFYFAAILVVTNIALIVLYFRDTKTERRPLTLKASEVFLTLWQAAKRPTVLKLSLVFFFAQLSLNTYFVFMDNYFFSRFGFDTLRNSIAMVVMGGALAIGSAFLVGPANERYPKVAIVSVSLVAMAASAALSIVNPSPLLAYVLVAAFALPFTLYYPTTLTLFSAAVAEDEQGWVMGVTVALYTLGAGIISVIGGKLMAIDIHLPFAVSLASLLLALILIIALWRSEDVRALDPASSAAGATGGP